MVSDSKRADKFLIKYAPIDSAQVNGDFSAQFTRVEGQARELRLKCLMADGSGVGQPAAEGPLQPAFSRNPSMADTLANPSAESFSRPDRPASTDSRSISLADSRPSVGSVDYPRPILGNSAVAMAAAQPLPPSTPSLSHSNDGLEIELRNARAKIQQLLARNTDLTKQVDDLKKTLLNASTGGEVDAAKEWNTLVESQQGVPPVLLVLVAIFCFLLGLLF